MTTSSRAWGAPPRVVDVVSWELAQRVQDRDAHLNWSERHVLDCILNGMRKGRDCPEHHKRWLKRMAKDLKVIP